MALILGNVGQLVDLVRDAGDGVLHSVHRVRATHDGHREAEGEKEDYGRVGH
jgi:hypothetical protein